MLVLVSVFTLALTTPALAEDNVVHSSGTDSGTLTRSLFPDEAACLPGATIITFNYSADYKLTTFVSGPQAGSSHYVAQGTNTFEALSPTGAYTGTSKFTDNFMFTDSSQRMKEVGQTVGTAPDGSRVKYVLNAHLRIKDGTVQRFDIKINCGN